MTDSLKNFYDNLYANNINVFGTFSADFLERVFKQIKPTGNLALDIGAGQGLASRLLANNNYEVDAIDISDNALMEIQAEPRIHRIITRIENFPLQKKYDLVHVALVSHHISADTFTNLLKTIQLQTNFNGLNVFQIFTTNSDFYKQRNGDYFFDDGVVLDAIYAGWEILIDETSNTSASTGIAKNEVRSVVFRKLS